MKTHAAIGAEVLSNGKSELMTIAQTIALTHHEKWNGAGYPNGLHGEDIPLWGRIVAVCDVFDALTSARPYKPAWPVEQALTELRQQQGKHFEPGLIDLFHEILPEILEIKTAYHD